MWVTIRDFEIALGSKSYLDHVFYGIFLRRGWYAYPCIIFLLNTLFNYIGWFEDYDFSFNLVRYITFPFIVYFVLGLILGLVERNILFGFDKLSKDDKIRKIKLFFFISSTISMTTFVLAINYNKFIIPEFLSYEMLKEYYINIPLAIIMGIIFTLIFRPYKKELPIIERKGLLLDNESENLNKEV
jgi:hypothetical protein